MRATLLCVGYCSTEEIKKLVLCVSAIHVTLYPTVVFHMDEVFRSTGLCVRIKKVASILCALRAEQESQQSPWLQVYNPSPQSCV